MSESRLRGKKSEILLLNKAALQSSVLLWKIKDEWLSTKRPSDYLTGLKRAVISQPMTGEFFITGTNEELGMLL